MGSQGPWAPRHSFLCLPSFPVAVSLLIYLHLLFLFTPAGSSLFSISVPLMDYLLPVMQGRPVGGVSGRGYPAAGLPAPVVHSCCCPARSGVPPLPDPQTRDPISVLIGCHPAVLEAVRCPILTPFLSLDWPDVFLLGLFLLLWSPPLSLSQASVQTFSGPFPMVPNVPACVSSLVAKSCPVFEQSHVAPSALTGLLSSGLHFLRRLALFPGITLHSIWHTIN